jgi:hypothetical protein
MLIRPRTSSLSALLVGALALLPAPGVSAAPSTPSCAPLVPFAPAAFSDSAAITNRFTPLPPGTQIVLDGQTAQGAHRVVFTVTDMVKDIDGVETAVVWDRDFQDGELTEAELAFFAQDDAGNVWTMGEYPEEYSDTGGFAGAPFTWVAGQSGAVPGLLMPGQPQIGLPEYLQGFAPTIDFLDCATVYRTGWRICVPVGCYSGVLITDETSPLDPESGHQRKFYAPGVGNVRIAAVGGDGETLRATAIKHLRGGWMRQPDSAVLRLERRAYKVSADYRATPPMERRDN